MEVPQENGRFTGSFAFQPTATLRLPLPATWIRPKKKPREPRGFKYPGDDLLSHPVTRAVPSALRGLTSVFGMGTGVTPSLESPE